MFFQPIESDVKQFHSRMKNKWSTTRKLVFSALLATIASLLQAAGGFIPIIGFGISPFTTLPIVIATLIAFRYGLFTYILTIVLLLLLEPTELFIFPFTTGLLGISLGLMLIHFSQRMILMFCNGIVLFLGICFPLYALSFPVFGPITSSSVTIPIIGAIFVFSLLYSWIWVEFTVWFVRKFKNIVFHIT